MALFEQQQQSMALPPVSGLFKKTKMCKFKRLNMCTRGSGCTYAHDESELQALPNLYRTKMCFEMSKTRVCQNISCPYAHTKTELRNVAFENSKAADEELDRMDRGQGGGAAFFGAKPFFWYPLMQAPDPTWSDGVRTPPQRRSFDAKTSPAVQMPPSPCSTFMSADPVSSIEDSDSWDDTPSSKDNCDNSQMSEGSDLGESDTQLSPAMKWTVKNTFLELSMEEDDASASGMVRCNSCPALK